MARIRTIKPDAFTSDSLSRVHRGIRWTFTGLWTYVDDEGRGRDDVRLIKAALYPLDDEVNLTVLAADLQSLIKVGCICRYEAEGRSYLHVPRWEHQKISHPTPSKYPSCALHDQESSGTDPEGSGIIPESIVKPKDPLRPERKGKEQGKEQGARGRATPDPLFDAFWSTYPRRAGKPAAIKAWKAALKRGADGPNLVVLAGVFAKANASTDVKFIPYPQKWLNDERYNDEQAPAQAGVIVPAYWSPTEAPPRHIADDPEAYSAWYAEQARNRGAAR